MVIFKDEYLANSKRERKIYVAVLVFVLESFENGMLCSAVFKIYSMENVLLNLNVYTKKQE